MYVCIVCGFNELDLPQYTEEGGPMFNICSCCGFQSGYHDLDREITIEEYRQQWIDKGAKWTFPPRPKDWDVKVQLQNINIEL